MKAAKTHKILKKVEDYINFLNPLSSNSKTVGEDEKRCIKRILKHNEIEWIDIQNPARKDLLELAGKYTFHPLHIEAFLTAGELERFEAEEKYVFVLLHSPGYDLKEDKINSYKVCIFAGKDYLITIHGDEPQALKKVFSECENNKDTREAFFKKSSGRLLYSVLDLFEKEISILLQSIIGELDYIEDLVFDVKISGIYKISQLRQKIVRLRRISHSFREIMQSIVASQNALIIKTNRYYRKISNNINKLWEILEETRETVDIYKDADFTVSTEKTNKILTVLTIVFTLSIPATLLGAFYGMNVKVPGGVGSKSWNFLGEFTTFYVILMYAVISAIIMLLFFKYKDWF